MKMLEKITSQLNGQLHNSLITDFKGEVVSVNYNAFVQCDFDFSESLIDFFDEKKEADSVVAGVGLIKGTADLVVVVKSKPVLCNNPQRDEIEYDLHFAKDLDLELLTEISLQLSN